VLCWGDEKQKENHAHDTAASNALSGTRAIAVHKSTRQWHRPPTPRLRLVALLRIPHLEQWRKGRLFFSSICGRALSIRCSVA
jgi:hypothetical protein